MFAVCSTDGGIARKFDSPHNVRLLHYAGFFLPWIWFDAHNVYLLLYLGSTSVLLYDYFLMLIYLLSSSDTFWPQVFL